MTDLYLKWDTVTGAGALGYVPDNDWPEIYTAVVLSLFCDQHANESDALPAGETDRRGWWGDDAGDLPVGSRLWLHRYLPRTLASLDLLKGDITAALQWLIDDGVASSIAVEMGFLPVNGWTAVISIDRGLERRRFDFAWKGAA